MGIMQNGEWLTQDFAKRNKDGAYVRANTQFRRHITADASSAFPAEAGRYHLMVAHACPWAYRTMTFRALKGLEDVISVAFVKPLMLENGWEFFDDGDPVTGAAYAHQVYAKADPDYSGRCSVPILWDRVHQTVVNNESAEIIRMLNSAFDALATREMPDMYPLDLRGEIDKINELIYHNVNNGVYRSGFATSQEAYETAVNGLFDTLDTLEQRLASRRYLLGERITEADWRLFATLVRFDAVYVGHFKCNRKRIADYPNLSNYTRELYQWPGIAGITDIQRIKEHYYGSHESINPFRIVPVGPDLDLDAPHDRARL
jgi:putative glutathione S-transferase